MESEREAERLATSWASSYDRALAWCIDCPDLRRIPLARLLIFHLAALELPWASPIFIEAARIRAQEIVSEIGWPKEAWLKPRVQAETDYRNALHLWINDHA